MLQVFNSVYSELLCFLIYHKSNPMQVVTGLLIAEVNVKTMCELGSGGVSLVIFLSMLWLERAKYF